MHVISPALRSASRVLIVTLHGLICSAGFFFVSGCQQEPDLVEIGGDKPVNDPAADPASPKVKLSASEQARLTKCDTLLTSVMGGIEFDRIDVDADASAGLADLNLWAQTCGDNAAAAELTSDEAVRHKMFPEGGFREWLEADKFSVADVYHIRNATLARAIGRQVVSDAGRDESVMIDLFDYVIRNITLVQDSFGVLPFDQLELWQSGLGTSRDRAWLFATLLRQYRLDAVAIEFPSGFNAQPYFLVAGITRGENQTAYLFDPLLGLPIPSLDDNKPIPSQVATWDEAANNDAVFRQIDQSMGGGYPLRSERLKTAVCYAIGDVPLFSPRMAALQDALPSDQSLILYTGLGENLLAKPGLLDRIASAFGREADSIALWSHPLLARIQQTKLTPAVQQLVQSRRESMQAPYRVSPAYDDNGQPILNDDGKPVISIVPADIAYSSNMRSARLAHFRGNATKALQAYLSVRIADPPELPLNKAAKSDADYWSAIMQYEKGEPENAERSLKRFLKDPYYPIYVASARRLLASIQASRGDFKGAAETALGGPVDPGMIALIARWKSQGLLEGMAPPPNPNAEDENATPPVADAAESQDSDGSRETPETMTKPDESAGKNGPSDESKSGAAQSKSADPAEAEAADAKLGNASGQSSDAKPADEPSPTPIQNDPSATKSKDPAEGAE